MEQENMLCVKLQRKELLRLALIGMSLILVFSYISSVQTDAFNVVFLAVFNAFAFVGLVNIMRNDRRWGCRLKEIEESLICYKLEEI